MVLQSKFRAFDETIKLKRFGENAELREKRDRVLTRLRSGLPGGWTFESINQGSYAMGTGIKPISGDYDIDVGIVLNNIDMTQHPDPVAVKSQVYKAVATHTQSVVFRRNCVTVFYQAHGEPRYHVDLAIYGKDWRGQRYLAVGKQHSEQSQRRWLESDPENLVRAVEQKHSGEDAAQFRRVVRYLKRWKDVNFPSEGNAAPRGIALTACALQWFAPHRTSPRYGQPTSANYDDLGSLRTIASRMLTDFGWSQRLSVRLPVPPGNDLFEKMTGQQMIEFRSRIEQLNRALEEASRIASWDERGASRTLRSVLGSDFPE